MIEKKIVIIGGRGNGTVIASTIEDCRKTGDRLSCVGFLNDDKSQKEINGYPVLGTIKGNDWKKLDHDCFFIYALSNVKQAYERHKLLKSLGIPSERYATIVHPSATVSDKAKLEKGVVIMPYVVVSPNCFIGSHSQMYAQSFIGHDSVLEEMVFVANNASIGGRVTIKSGSHIGSNSSVLERLIIGEYSVVGLASNVIKNTDDYGIYVGNPARKIGSMTL